MYILSGLPNSQPTGFQSKHAPYQATSDKAVAFTGKARIVFHA